MWWNRWFKGAKTKTPGVVAVTSLDRCVELARELRPALIVSISDPELRAQSKRTLKGVGRLVCPLDFHDIERAAPDLVAGEDRHVRAALAASAKVDVSESVIVHCHAGISRSAAMGLVVAVERETRRGLALEEAIASALEQLDASSPYARPNMLVAALGAQTLDLEKTSFMEKVWALHAR